MIIPLVLIFIVGLLGLLYLLTRDSSMENKVKQLKAQNHAYQRAISNIWRIASEHTDVDPSAQLIMDEITEGAKKWEIPGASSG